MKNRTYRQDQSSDDRSDGWARHSRDQLERMLSATPEQRLAWLEEAIRFAHEAKRQRKED